MAIKVSILALCFVLLVVIAEEMGVAMAQDVNCNPLELSPCANAITSASSPTPICCSKLKEQRSCLCQYVKDPNLQKLINSPNARKVATTCGSPFPTC